MNARATHGWLREDFYALQVSWVSRVHELDNAPSSPLLKAKLIFLLCALRGEFGAGPDVNPLAPPAMRARAFAGDCNEVRRLATGMNDWESVIVARCAARLEQCRDVSFNEWMIKGWG